MRIMGIDLSISSTGVSLPTAATFAIKPRSKGDARLREIADHLHVAAVGCGAELVVMEGLFGAYQGEAARVIPMLHGAVRLELQRLPVPYVVLHQSTLKLFATGRGGAKKDAMAAAARERLGREYDTDDECDADWCRVAGRTAYGLRELTDLSGPGEFLTMPPEQVQALRATQGPRSRPIAWPVVHGREPWPAGR